MLIASRARETLRWRNLGTGIWIRNKIGRINDCSVRRHDRSASWRWRSLPETQRMHDPSDDSTMERHSSLGEERLSIVPMRTYTKTSAAMKLIVMYLFKHAHAYSLWNKRLNQWISMHEQHGSRQLATAGTNLQKRQVQKVLHRFNCAHSKNNIMGAKEVSAGCGSLQVYT